MPCRRLAIAVAFALVGLPSGLAQDVLRGHGGPVRALSPRADVRELVSGSFDSTVIVWDLAGSTARRVLRFHDGAVNAVVALSDGCLASGGEDARIAVWCGSGDTPAHVLHGHEGPVTALAQLGAVLASGSLDGSVRAWSPASGRPAGVLARHKGPVTALAAGPDAVASAGMDGAVLWLPLAAHAGTQTGGSVALVSPVTALAVASDGEIVTASSDGHVRFLARASQGGTLTSAAELEVDENPLASLALSPDGRLIATAGLRGGIAVIDRTARRVVHRLTGPGLPVWSLTFDSDSRTLLSGGADRVIRRWDAVAGKALTSSLPERDQVAEAITGGERGAVVFRACQACHTLSPDGGNRAGPTLYGVIGRRIGTAPGYVYSDALPRLDIVWSRETIARLFEVGPAAYTPGTKMPEQTITDPADRLALVDWLARATQR